METHVEIPDGTEYFCRAAPLGKVQWSWTWAKFLVEVEKDRRGEVTVVSSSGMFCKRCYELAKLTVPPKEIKWGPP